ncbi:MAG: hypothetical protein JKY00_09135 [Roseicyclus sp.]|nr:hypothetical protein [Roseicyclus sp.]
MRLILICLVSMSLSQAASHAALADADPPRPFVDAEAAVQISGPAEVVFDWTVDRCADHHFADLPVRAFRGADGAVNLILGHHVTRRMVGPDFGTLSVECDILLASTSARDPEQFANTEWIAATYATTNGDGDIVHALIHNEYQGNRYPECRTADYFRCWYNTITYARSNDGGASFGYPIAPPQHLVASLPEPYRPDEGIFGAFSPSNILSHDGHFYVFLKVQTYPLETQHTCLMRTDTLGDPDSWRFWDGAGFNGLFADPYRDDLRAMRATTCTPVALPQIAQMYEAVTWNTELQRFILIGTSSDPARSPNPYGFYYALSEDLITWSMRQPLLEVRLPWRATGREAVYLYPTLIDHDSDSRNYETSGATAYLYFTRLNFGSGDLDRDLIRMPVSIRANE